jgi:hypothetical protein
VVAVAESGLEEESRFLRKEFGISKRYATKEY